MTLSGEMTAEEFAMLINREVFDVETAAAYLGIETKSLEFAVYRKRIMYVKWGARKCFMRRDLDEYREKAAPGWGSQIGADIDPIVVERPW